MNVNVLETIILNRRDSLDLVVVCCSGEALLHLQLKDDTTSPQFSLTLQPRTWEETEARAEPNAELSWELSSYPCQKFLISPRCLLPLCRVAILLLHSPAMHAILSPMLPHWGPLMEAAASVARLWENQLLIKLIDIIPSQSMTFMSGKTKINSKFFLK